jgi:type IV pilus assembly protein PilE
MRHTLQQDQGVQNGFTLVELLAVLAILCALGVLVLPAYQSQVLTARRGLARLELLKIMTRQEQYFLNHLKYADSLTQLGFPAHPYALTRDGNVAPASATDSIYLIGLDATSRSYIVTASPTDRQREDTGCQVMSIESNGIRHSSGTYATQECW